MPARAGMRQAWALGEFRALWAAQLLSVAGDQLARVALTVLVYDRTRSALLAAVAYAASIAPLFLGGIALSGLADRWPRKTVMLACDLARVPLTALMAAPGMPLAALIGLLCTVTALGAPFGSARAATYPDILADAYPAGTAITMTTYQIAQVLGFAVGGTIVGLAGARAALAADAATFAGSAALVAIWVRPRPAQAAPGPGRGTIGGIAAAVKLVFGDRAARTPMLLGWISAAYNVPEGLAAPLASGAGGGPVAVGTILGAAALGASAGALALSRLPGPAVRQRLYGPLAVGACAVLALIALRPALPVILVILLISGLCDGTYQVEANAAFVAAVPAAQRGQAFGLALGGMQLGQGLAMIVAGAAAQHAGPWPVIAVSGAAGAVASILITLS